MKKATMLPLLAFAWLAPVPATAVEPPHATLAQTESRCGPRPMKPMSCLNGTWVCRCRGSGQVCDWELIGCQTTPGTSRPLGESNWPGSDPGRPGTLGR